MWWEEGTARGHFTGSGRLEWRIRAWGEGKRGTKDNFHKVLNYARVGET